MKYIVEYFAPTIQLNMPKAKQKVRKTVTTQYLLEADGFAHRVNGPAVIVKSDDGSVQEKYLQMGRYHREDGPAIVVKSKSGKILRREYWLNGEQVDRQAIQKRTTSHALHHH